MKPLYIFNKWRIPLNGDSPKPPYVGVSMFFADRPGRLWLEERLEARVAQAEVDQETQREARWVDHRCPSGSVFGIIYDDMINR